MFNFGHTTYKSKFDFINPSEKGPVYQYNPACPEFTFIIDYTENNPERISNVVLSIYTTSGKVVKIPAVYSESIGSWVAKEKFYSSSIPINVSVSEKIYTDTSKTVKQLNSSIMYPQLQEDASLTIVENGPYSFSAKYVPNDESNTQAIITSSLDFTDSFIKTDDFTEIAVKPNYVCYHSIITEEDGKFLNSSQTMVIPSELWAVMYNDMKDSNPEQYEKIKELTPDSITKKWIIYNISEDWEEVPAQRMLNLFDTDNTTMQLTSYMSDRVGDLIGLGLSAEENNFNNRRARNNFRRIDELARRAANLERGNCADGNNYSKDILDALRDLANRYFDFDVVNNKIGAIGDIVGLFTNEAGNVFSGFSSINGLSAQFGFDRSIYGIEKELEKFEEFCPPPDDDDPPDFPPSAEGIIDPSGYVYEAVESNRIEGVKATLYSKINEYDMYGDPTEVIKVWDSAPYFQQNPLFTNSEGRYAWDVPEGKWQVKYDKESYETAYSEWLNVPPPQFDVNVGIISYANPTIKCVNAYTDGIEFTFDKYLKIDSITVDKLVITSSGNAVNGTIEYINEEKNNENISLASKIKFVPSVPFAVDDNIDIKLSKNILSYSNVTMSENYSDTKTIELRPQITSPKKKTVILGENTTVAISVEPKEVVAGRTLNVISQFPEIAEAQIDTVTIDRDGNASIPINTYLPGAAEFIFTLAETGLQAQTTLEVNAVNPTIKLTKVKSNTTSGTVLEKGSTITLTSDENADIYYTTDLSCPCIVTSTSRIKYTNPIVINNDITIIAYAVKSGYTDSDTVGFEYKVPSSAQKVSKPTANPASGSISSGTTVTLTTATENAKLFYTTDGSTPTEASTAYSAPISVTSATTIKAIAVKTGMTNSDVMSESYTISGGGGSGGGGGSSVTSYKITVTQGQNGTISPDTTSVNKNKSQSFTITANKGYVIESVLVNGENVGAVLSYTFENVVKAGTITATFKKIEEVKWINPFDDVKENDWFYAAVKFAFEKGITSGVSENLYNPQGKVSRAQFITMLCRAYGISEMTGDNFADAGNTWYTGYLAAAKQLGISNGVGDNKFAPEKEITREEMVTLIYNYLKSVGKAAEETNTTDFTDKDAISDWAKTAVSFASKNGIMKGKDNNMFAPNDTATRAELAQIFYNMLSEK